MFDNVVMMGEALNQHRTTGDPNVLASTPKHTLYYRICPLDNRKHLV